MGLSQFSSCRDFCEGKHSVIIRLALCDSPFEKELSFQNMPNGSCCERVAGSVTASACNINTTERRSEEKFNCNEMLLWFYKVPYFGEMANVPFEYHLYHNISMFHCTLTFYMERFTVIFDVRLGYLSYLSVYDKSSTLCLRITYRE